MADCTSPLSSRGNVEGGGIGQTQGGRYSVPDGQKPSNDGAGGGNPPSGSGSRGCPIPGTGDYVINLTYDGHLTMHHVDQHMLVGELATEAAHVYGLNAFDLILMLFGMNRKLFLVRIDFPIHLEWVQGARY